MKGLDIMKNNAYKKTTFGKFAIDFKGKKAVVKAGNRKARHANKKACAVVD